MKYGQQFAEELSGTSAEVQQASIDYKKLKKSIKRIENELQALGLSAEVLKELLSAGSDTNATAVGIEDAASAQSIEEEIAIRRTASAKSLQKRLAEKQRIAKKKRKQARARAEYELAGG